MKGKNPVQCTVFSEISSFVGNPALPALLNELTEQICSFFQSSFYAEVTGTE